MNAFFWKRLRILTLIFGAFSFLSLLFISCENESLPEFRGTFIKPIAGATFTFGDTINISGIVECDRNIESVTAELTTSITIRKLLGQNCGETFNFDTDLILNDDVSSSGNYTLRLLCSADGKSGYVATEIAIHIDAIPRTTKKILFVSGHSYQPSLYELNGSGSVLINSYNQNFLGLKINSKNQKIFMCCKENVRGIDASDLTEQFQLSPVAINSSAFITSDNDEEQLILGRNDGNIIYYDALGNRIGETGENVFQTPLLTMSTDAYIFSSILKNGDRKIAVNFYPGGSPRQELNIDFDVTGFNSAGPNEVLVSGNRLGHTLIYKYLISGNTLQLLKDIPATFTNHSFNKLSNTFLLLTDHGIIRYQYPSNIIITVSSSIFSGADYDEVNDIFYCYSGNNLFQLQGNSFLQTNSWSLGDSVLAVGVLYSK